MSTNVSIEVTGVKEALRELNSMDKSARRQLTRDFRQIVQPTLTEAKNLVPSGQPMSGWARKWDPQAKRQGGSSGRTVFPYDPSLAPKGVVAFVSGKKPREFAGVVRNLSAFGVQYRTPSATLFDQANNWKTPQGEQMVKVLRQRFGNPSRIMWRAWERTEDDVTGNVKQLIEDLMFRVNQKVKI